MSLIWDCNIPNWWLAEWQAKIAKVSCGSDSAEGKAGDGARVEGLGERLDSTCLQGKSGHKSDMSSRSESRQNCAGLGVRWGISPAGIHFAGESAQAFEVQTFTVNADAATGTHFPAIQLTGGK